MTTDSPTDGSNVIGLPARYPASWVALCDCIKYEAHLLIVQLPHCKKVGLQLRALLENYEIAARTDDVSHLLLPFKVMIGLMSF